MQRKYPYNFLCLSKEESSPFAGLALWVGVSLSETTAGLDNCTAAFPLPFVRGVEGVLISDKRKKREYNEYHTYPFFSLSEENALSFLAILALGVEGSLSSLERITWLDAFPPIFVRGVEGALSSNMRKEKEIDRIPEYRTYLFLSLSEKALSIFTTVAAGLALARGVGALLSSLETTMGLEFRTFLLFFIPGLWRWRRPSSSLRGSDLTVGAWFEPGGRGARPLAVLEILTRLVLVGLCLLNVGWATMKSTTRTNAPFWNNGGSNTILTILCHI